MELAGIIVILKKVNQKEICWKDKQIRRNSTLRIIKKFIISEVISNCLSWIQWKFDWWNAFLQADMKNYLLVLKTNKSWGSYKIENMLKGTMKLILMEMEIMRKMRIIMKIIIIIIMWRVMKMINLKMKWKKRKTKRMKK